ncbi:MAG: 2-oxoacid:acceptor oxidoreductase family protein [Planctomycetota bacterium]
MEIRLHGRGGQGGVTCAKILAAVYGRLGKSVQTFGDYAGERSGAPVRAYTRVSDEPITNRNKVYEPDHLMVLDHTLLGQEVLSGLKPGGTLILNTSDPPQAFQERYEQYRVATVDATAIARKHKIGTRSVVITNTTIAGAWMRVFDIPFVELERVYQELGFEDNLEAAREAYESVRVREAAATVRARLAAASMRAGDAAPSVRAGDAPASGLAAVATPSGLAAVATPSGLAAVAAAVRVGPPAAPAHGPAVIPLIEHVESPPTFLKTGAWRTQRPIYVENTAPCSAFCPAGNDVVGFVRALARHGEDAAAAILGRTTPLAAVCGHVCPAPCMEGCNRAEYDGAVNIRGAERWIATRTPVAESGVAEHPHPKRIAIVGGGPAGLSAAYTLARLGHKPAIFEGEEKLGGILQTGIPPFRLPRAVVEREVEDILELGVEAKTGTFLDRDAIVALTRQYDAVIIATGLQSLSTLKVEGYDLDGVEQGIPFLHRVNLEGGARLSGHVVVLGGGNTAVDCARTALRSGASRVTIAYRRTRLEMPAIREEIEEAEAEGVELLVQRAPIGFAGNGRVTGVTLAEVEMGEPDASGRRRPVVTDRLAQLECQSVILAIGQSADLSLVPKDWELKEGRFFAKGTATNCFAAGDLSTGDGTVTHAIGDGRRAAGRALVALGEDVTIFQRPDREKAVPATLVRFDHFARAEPQHEILDEPARRTRSFALVNKGLADGPTEATRCFSCGHCTLCDTCLVYCPEGIITRNESGTGYHIDYDYCKGCGLCVAECPRLGMEMVQ